VEIPLVLFSGPQQIVFYAIYFAWLVGCEIIGATVYPRFRYGARGGQRRDGGSLFINVVTLVFAIFVDFELADRSIGFLPAPAYYIGIALMIIGIILRLWAIVVLGRFFTLKVKVQSDHRIVEVGPYRLLRHPSYSGLLLVLLGIALALQTWVGLVINILVFALVFGYRIYVEEKALRGALGERYIAYSKRTKRLIPYVL
jgi:protein-S-isoprenylcysteine O-methyltransferase Ste14